jgi:hypothetical protein
MKFTFLMLCLLLTACAYTVVKDAAGHTRFRTLGNIKKLTYQDETTKIVIEVLNHSTPSAATGKAMSDIAGSIGGVLAGGATGALLVP